MSIEWLYELMHAYVSVSLCVNACVCIYAWCVSVKFIFILYVRIHVCALLHTCESTY